MEKIRVLLVVKTLQFGGVENNLLNFVRAIDPQRFEIHIAYSFGGEHEEAYLKSGYRLFKFAEGIHKIKSLASVAIVFRLARYLKRHRIQLVHTFNFNAHAWGLLAAKLSGAKVIEHVHDFRYFSPEEYRLRAGAAVNQWRFIKYFKGASDLVVVLTEQNRRFILDHGFYPEDQVLKIPNGISLAPSRGVSPEEIRARLGLDPERFVFFTSGRMVQDKNIGLILRIAPKIIEKHPNVSFLISGTGPLLETYRGECRAKNLAGHVVFLGFCPDLLEILAVANAVLHPSFLELHSSSILEALSMKLPVLASKGVGCNDEMFVNWINGILLDPFKPDEWVDAILKILGDADLRARIGRSGFELCRERFDIKTAAKTFEGLYAGLAGAPAAKNE